MIERYTLPQMGQIWSEENKFQTWLKVEILACEAQAQLGNIPRKALQAIRRKAKFSLSRIQEIESETKHDVLAFLTNLTESIGPEGRYVHHGMTSSDILDISLSYLMVQAGETLVDDLKKLMAAVKTKAHRYKKTPIMGRTHGIIAEPTTLGLKFALWYSELQRDLQRLKDAIANVSYGKISGAVGNFANIDPRVEAYVCRKLKLKVAPVSNQVLQRDRHAQYLCTLAIIGGSLEKFATEVRNLSKSEIGELSEPFTKGQKGSSAMPHKKNPITCERICGLARILRSNSSAALENISLWGERDISHSSVERVIIPDSTILLDYMLVQFRDVVKGLKVNAKRMLENIYAYGGVAFSQNLLLALTPKVKSRDEAYDLVQKCAHRAMEMGGDFKKLVQRDPTISSKLSERELGSCFDLNRYSKEVDYIFKRVFR
ncbi:MAG: adenylosuccinate lyase [Candidatus Zixiibacteriota bacterium]|nr:MAG: adenylosuccinate lyase [candidate division Zixibacteria bacterium]